ncbi:bifunctional demethylmenaquinone methyltransferase/2-methoxy-6-polyprenyl-1,4-benzoquinol methylase UbiE [Lusitaniella coriacea LEGE 07157]|uniref:2-phytyl-1,4-naphtoquinone methyltransferase n=1 Tax=Lusitaniella coriacea LEGE 07157 TaxID=945747 RepID=A0A8J7B779_9CYAN|nr:bifunctional demethylmenaquinone methyltransferase/2-methoxy-6-polyprenyl-1,4-benzoquinol methylase UbiE [Lusitaniella coriacea]MBE9115006.1 bifunctional demethylmenaquinone methyltransferase/2-methoxy-6-polyprenyl-1,4-benzoquinol methylase UbiE [Lusitaniella coriacea LEGE 07157]
MTSPSASEIQALFNRIAPVYDQLNQGLSLGLHRIWKQMAINWIEPKWGDVGLDICCGSGDLAMLLARKVGKTGRVTGLDFSSAQLAIARQRAFRRYPLLSLDWVEGDALNLPFRDRAFDCATMGYGLRNLTDIPRGLQELHRVLKPQAKAALLDFNHPEHSWLNLFQQWYLDTVVVPTAQNLGLKEDYAYIAPSLERFPKGSQQVHLAKEVGFSAATHYPIAGGMMGILVLKK